MAKSSSTRKVHKRATHHSAHAKTKHTKTKREGKGPEAEAHRIAEIEEEQEIHADKIQKITDTLEAMAKNERTIASTQRGVVVKVTEQQKDINRLMELVTSMAESLADITMSNTAARPAGRM